MFEPERLHGDLGFGRLVSDNDVAHVARQVVDRHPGCVYDFVRTVPKWRKEMAFSGKAIQQSTATLQRVAPPISFVPAHQALVFRVQEDDAVRNSMLTQLNQSVLKRVEEFPAPNVHDRRQFVDSFTVAGHHAGQRQQHGGRQVVDHVPAVIFERVSRLRPSSAGPTGYDQDLVR